MALIVHLPEELAPRLERLAASRKVSAEELAIEAIEAQLSCVHGGGVRGGV